MILIFDYFETLLAGKSMDFNRGLKVFWEKYYKDRCNFENMKLSNTAALLIRNIPDDVEIIDDWNE